MSAIDRERVAAVKTLRELGFTFREGSWHPPTAAFSKGLHELRAPRNAILILARQLGENADGNLSAKQIEFARTIHSAGTDISALLNDMLESAGARAR